MKSYGLLLLVLVTAVMVSLGGLAWAQAGPGGGQGRPDPKAMCQQRYEKIDANQDGTVTKEEFMASQDQLFGMRDADRNGQLSKEEFCPERPAGMGPKAQ